MSIETVAQGDRQRWASRRSHRLGGAVAARWLCALVTFASLAACASKPAEKAAEPAKPIPVAGGVAAGAGGGTVVGAGYGLAASFGCGPLAPLCAIFTIPVGAAVGAVAGGVGGGVAASNHNKKIEATPEEPRPAALYGVEP